MSKSTSVVIQGPLHSYLPQVLRQYQDQSWIEQIIISTWIGEPNVISDDSRITVVYNEDVANPGVGNRNRQIKSSAAGLGLVKTDLAIKARSDQIIYDLNMMKEFYEERNRGEIYACGLYTFFPFHPRDHFFMGKTHQLQSLFDLPFDPYNGPADYTTCLRAEAWLGAHYYAKHDLRAAHMLANYPEYLVDNAPKIEEARELDAELREHLFKPFPRIEMQWPKHNLRRYHYDVSAAYSEYWYEDEGETYSQNRIRGSQSQI